MSTISNWTMKRTVVELQSLRRIQCQILFDEYSMVLSYKGRQCKSRKCFQLQKFQSYGSILDRRAHHAHTRSHVQCELYRKLSEKKDKNRASWIGIRNNFPGNILCAEFVLFCLVFRHKTGSVPGKCSNCSFILQFTCPRE